MFTITVRDEKFLLRLQFFLWRYEPHSATTRLKQTDKQRGLYLMSFPLVGESLSGTLSYRNELVRPV